MSKRAVIFEILATPAHLWLWCCARLVGWSIEFGPASEMDQPRDTPAPND